MLCLLWSLRRNITSKEERKEAEIMKNIEDRSFQQEKIELQLYKILLLIRQNLIHTWLGPCFL